nr:MAG TPA: hypothetical protein [Caudoviricetes sp.]
MVYPRTVATFISSSASNDTNPFSRFAYRARSFQPSAFAMSSCVIPLAIRSALIRKQSNFMLFPFFIYSVLVWEQLKYIMVVLVCQHFF